MYSVVVAAADFLEDFWYNWILMHALNILGLVLFSNIVFYLYGYDLDSTSGWLLNFS